MLQALRGENHDALSRELRVMDRTIAQWREQLLAGGQAPVKRCRGRTPSKDDKLLDTELGD
jgi:hypothetical protein